MEEFISNYPALFYAIVILAVWDALWKLIALWRAAQNNQLGWFVAIGLLNTLGILPIIYLITHKNKRTLLLP